MRLLIRLGHLCAIIGVSACSKHPSPETGKAAPSSALIGAIRWDAWNGGDAVNSAGAEVERTLGPKRWHDRLPFFAEALSNDAVRVRENTPEIMARENAMAHDAGIDYWAFCMYKADDPATTGGIDLYLASPNRDAVKFAMVLQSGASTPADVERLVRYFRVPSYQRVLGDRPLLYVVGVNRPNDPSWPSLASFLKDVRTGAASAGLGTPYIVSQWGWDNAGGVADAYGFDAISSYALNFDDKGAGYDVLTAKAESKWDEWRATGHDVVPLVTTGWDRRPRVEHPVSWEGADKADAIHDYYEPPTAAQLEAHLRAGIAWAGAHPESARASTLLIYAWNELDEGGWLTPSLWPAIGDERLQAVKRARLPAEH